MAKFNMNSSTTSNQVAEMYGDSAKGKTVIVTGAATGLGFETARILAKNNAKEVVVLTRSLKKSEDAVSGLRAVVGETECILTPMECDLASIKNVKTFVQDYIDTGKPVDILINNAGVMGCPKMETTDGFEMQFGVNHLGHFALTEGLLPVLRASAKDEPSRVVSLSSMAHFIYGPRPDGILFDDLEGKKYDEYERYGQSKLANVLLAKGIALQEDPSQVVAYSLHPGVIIMGTSLLRHISLSAFWSNCKGMWNLGWKSVQLFAAGNKTVPQGTATTILCALAPVEELTNGGYYSDCNLETENVHPAIDKPELATKLWGVSKDLIAKI